MSSRCLACKRFEPLNVEPTGIVRSSDGMEKAVIYRCPDDCNLPRFIEWDRATDAQKAAAKSAEMGRMRVAAAI